MMCLALHALSRVRLISVDNVNRRCVHQSVTGLALIEVSGNPWRDLTLLIPMWVLNTSSTPTLTGAIEKTRMRDNFFAIHFLATRLRPCVAQVWKPSQSKILANEIQV